jgi:hypothetical protein
MELLQKQDWVLKLTVFGTYLHVGVSDEKQGARKIREILETAGIRVQHIERIAPSLEDVFLQLLEQQRSQKAA